MSQLSHRHHAIELAVTDVADAKRFYAEAFGWRFTDYGAAYAGIRSPAGGSAPEVGGLRQERDVPKGGGPLVLLFSDDLDRSVEAVRKAGGEVVAGPYGFPGGRRFHFTDPSGDELGVWAEAWRSSRRRYGLRRSLLACGGGPLLGLVGGVACGGGRAPG